MTLPQQDVGKARTGWKLWLLSVAGLMLVWSVAAWLAQSRALPPPPAVFSALLVEYRSGELLFHLGMTLQRVFAAFFLALTLGSLIGIALGSNRKLNQFFDLWLILALNIPALVVIVLAYLWFGLNELAAISAVAANKIPNVVVTIREGVKALDTGLADMANVFRFGRVRYWRHVALPQLQPYFAVATRSGIALIWKIVLVVELLGRSNGVGFQIHLYFQLFDVATILAYTLAFVAVMLVVEFGLLQQLETRATRWRLPHA